MRRRGEQQASNLRSVLETIKQHATERNWGLTENCIKELNRIVLTGITSESYSAGDYKSRQNLILDGQRKVVFIPPPPCQCATLVSQLIRIINNQIVKRRTGSPDSLHPIHIAAIACARLIAIHPFAHGNGRTSRALATMILAAFEYTPLPSQPDDGNTLPVKTLEWYFDQYASEYYAGLHAVQRGNWMIWLDLFAEAVHATMRCPRS